MTLEDTIYDQLPDLISALSLSINETQSSGLFDIPSMLYLPSHSLKRRCIHYAR
jgi:hypothetical protein